MSIATLWTNDSFESRTTLADRAIVATQLLAVPDFRASASPVVVARTVDTPTTAWTVSAAVREAEVGSVEWGTRRVALRHPIPIEITRNGKYWIWSNAELGIEAIGRSDEAACSAFRAEFVAIWDHLGEEKPENLTLDARRLRTAIRWFVSASRPVP